MYLFDVRYLHKEYVGDSVREVTNTNVAKVGVDI